MDGRKLAFPFPGDLVPDPKERVPYVTEVIEDFCDTEVIEDVYEEPPA